MADTPRQRGWQGWHFFAIVAAAVALIGGVWAVVAGGPQPGPAPSPSPSPSLVTPAPVSPTPGSPAP